MSQFPSPSGKFPSPFGRYQLLKCLGEGGMGAVYLAHDTQLERSVALKIPKLEAGEQSQVLARFYREARSAAALRHPNICPVHEVGEVDSVPYLSMAYIEGKPLSQVAKGQNQRQVALLARKLALALLEAHRLGVVHRDLKPENIMIDTRGEPIIMDFGLARRARGETARLTQSGMAMGTPAYMAPEQVQGKLEEIGPVSDIYSLGVILYELLAGRLPFSGSDAMATLSQVLLETPPPPSQFRPDLDKGLEAICLKAMAKKAEDRYASMAELSTALQEYLSGSSSKLPPPPASPAAKPPAPPQTPLPGYQFSQMGGLRSQAQIGAEHGERPAPFAPEKKSSRRRHRHKAGNNRPPLWPWFAGGGAIAALIVVASVLVFRNQNHAANGSEHSERTQQAEQPTSKPASIVPNATPTPNTPREIEPLPGMKFVNVPAGTFWMSQDEKNAQRQVEIMHKFEIAIYPVTQEQWQAVMGNNPSWFSRQGGGKDNVKDIPDAELKQFPVEMVSWNDAQEFLRMLNEREKDSGWRYRLPAEAEWEYACRGAALSKEECSFNFYFAQPTNDLDSTRANFNGIFPDGNGAQGPFLERTCKVGSYPQPNRLGLHDMHGNVMQWCENIFDKGPDRVVRGGCWTCKAETGRAGSRSSSPPTDRLKYIGFRVLRIRE